ncbi:MAG: glycosyltransferase family 2 protein [Candidatus Sericytochromatia bacterium]
MINEKISIILITFNRFKLLERALSSIENQTYSNIEVILINNGGKSPKEILKKSLLDIKLIDVKASTIGKARNIGIKKATGDFICFLDDDDFFYPNHLEVNLLNLKKNKDFKVSFSASIMNVFYNNNYENIEQKVILDATKFDYDSLLVKGYIPVLSPVIKKECLSENFYFDETLLSNEDWDFWIKLGNKFNFLPINIITSEFFFNKDKDLTNYYKSRSIIFDKYKSKNRFFEIEKERFLIEKNDNLAVFYFNKGFYKKALDEFEIIIKNDPENILYFKNYIDICLKNISE